MRRLLILVLSLVLTACSATITTRHVPPQAYENQPWLSSGLTYRLRHDGVLQLGSRTIPMTGFMVLDTANHQATVALLTGLGIKLATLNVQQDGYQVIKSSPIADRIPHFLDQCAASIQWIFLKANQPKPNSVDWDITYDGNLAVGSFALPKKTVFTNHGSGYTVTLQLNRAEVR